jgi:hypothetical protein
MTDQWTQADQMDEAREMARDALGDQADDEVLLQEVAEQIYESMPEPTP